MVEQLPPDPTHVKAESERQLLAIGARICNWLPHTEHTRPRDLNAIAERALVLNALIQLAFGAPPLVIRQWLLANNLCEVLADSERFILDETPQPLEAQVLTNLRWSIEALWALMWVCGRVSKLEVDQPVGNELASMLPSLRASEPASAFFNGLQRRSDNELLAMRDLIYRAHWYARDGSLKGEATAPIVLDVIMERRKAIEWATDDRQSWDETEGGT